MRKLLPREKRLLCVAALLACLVPFAPLLNPQLHHLRQVQAHISTVRPSWEDFKRQNPDLASVDLFAYTGGDGMFGAYGHVLSHTDLAKVRTFMESTSPPLPIYLGAVRVFDVRAQNGITDPKIAEPASRANRR